MSDVKTGFLIGIGVFAALAILGIVQGALARVVGGSRRG